MVEKEWELNFLSIIYAGFRSKIHVAKLVAVAAREPSMIPRTHDQHKTLRRGVLLHEVEHSEWALWVFLVVPAPDDHHRRLDPSEVLPNRTGLPKFIIG